MQCELGNFRDVIIAMERLRVRAATAITIGAEVGTVIGVAVRYFAPRRSSRCRKLIDGVKAPSAPRLSRQAEQHLAVTMHRPRATPAAICQPAAADTSAGN